MSSTSTCIRTTRTATRVPFADDAPAPATPRGHLETLLVVLAERGHTVWVHEQYSSGHLSVLNVFIPGMERFLLICDDQIVLPGPRGRAARNLAQAKTHHT